MYIAYIGETYSLREHRNTHVYRYNKDDPVGPTQDHKTTYEQMKYATASNSTVSADTCVRGSYYLNFFRSLELKGHHGCALSLVMTSSMQCQSTICMEHCWE